MSCYPANIRCTPVYVFLFEVKDPFMRCRNPNHITTDRMNNSFWFYSRSARVKNEKHILGIHLFGWADDRDRLDNFMIPYISFILHFYRLTRPLNYDHFINTRYITSGL